MTPTLTIVMQRALFLSSQHKYEQAIDEFEKLESKNDPLAFIVIAKAKMKCQNYKGTPDRR
jgi:hypothetical protein